MLVAQLGNSAQLGDSRSKLTGRAPGRQPDTHCPHRTDLRPVRTTATYGDWGRFYINRPVPLEVFSGECMLPSARVAQGDCSMRERERPLARWTIRPLDIDHAGTTTSSQESIRWHIDEVLHDDPRADCSESSGRGAHR